jgi:hypothetical protein
MEHPPQLNPVQPRYLEFPEVWLSEWWLVGDDDPAVGTELGNLATLHGTGQIDSAELGRRLRALAGLSDG